MAKAERIEWVDAAKGLSVMLVVFGHVYYQDAGPSLRLLRMPLFFFLSGFVFKPRALGDFLWKRVNSLVVPHFIYIVAITSVAVVLAQGWPELGEAASLGRAHPVLGTMWGGTHLHGYFIAYWFLPALFLTLLLFNFALNAFPTATDWRTVATVLLIFAGGLAMAPIDLPFGANIAPIALLFVWAGAAYRRIEVPGWVAVPAAMLLAVALHDGGTFDMRTTLFARPWLSFPAALAACHLAILGCQALVRVDWIGKVLTSLGGASMVILLLHECVHIVLVGSFGLPRVVVFFLALWVPYLCYTGLRRTNWLGRWLLLGQPPEPARVIRGLGERLRLGGSV